MTTRTAAAIVWLRNDLRLADNPALLAAVKSADSVTALYIHETGPVRAPGAAARWWLHHSLADLGNALAERGIPLVTASGDAPQCLADAIASTGASAVFWNRRYAPQERAVDAGIKDWLKRDGVQVVSFAANVLIEPWDIATGQGKPYSVFTPFWRALKQRDIPTPLPRPEGDRIAPTAIAADYQQPAWASKLAPYWRIGESGAREALADFLDERLEDYKLGRDFPAATVTSRLSPHLRFGEISPRQVWHAAMALAQREPGLAEAVDKFLSELSWRDFNYHQLYHRDDISTVPMQAKYAGIKWRHAPDDLKAWQTGQTGFPIVDAGMRELWETGTMHNRVRMLVASLLAKNLLIDWRLGEHWFWDCLLDADVASNPGNWQWVAGSGLDASPYFRIFNPVVQGERFDASGDYVRQWVPEIADLPDKWVHQPFAAPAEVLRQANVVLGETYPVPIVDLKTSRERALAAAKAL
ncbi:deoxyribodipyrimidine photolyase [Devosia limi DSM 17137]|uniref:Deoxyribodipyrimidine photo-lyase n=1 Tax=Devosia limi DSM 17137 TaxID=1121477 RepID=A0A0F5LN22_9HYPH|nr:deoxyribodipyrimidine photo-lyase [Devosia limi]KKB83771.1 deoxyribodipyrimidine photolyase [Devosia limi DSM 17137]SHE70599.1 deoxyribodipyrimidine photo-lyase [Devosia limi DSM 17137]